MNNFTLPLAIVIGAALIAGAILLTAGVYEFESVHMFSVNRYNKVTGSIYYCTLGDPCEPYEPTQEPIAPKADSQESEFQFEDVHKGRDLFDDAQEGVNLLREKGVDRSGRFEEVPVQNKSQ